MTGGPESDTALSPQSHNSEKEAHPLPNPMKLKPSFTIVPVRTPEDLNATISLFTAYVDSLNLDLSFQDFQTEMASMPGKYSPSKGGELLLARLAPTSDDTSPPKDDGEANKQLGEAIGCVALRALSSLTTGSDAIETDRYCEMKRLYVSPSARGLGLGRALADRIIGVAETLGYDEMRLDSLASMKAAQAMYTGLGFVDIEAYCYNPVEGVRYLGLKLPRTQCGDEKYVD